MKEEKFPNSRKPSHRWVCGEFWNLRGQHNQEEKKKKTKTETKDLGTETHPWEGVVKEEKLPHSRKPSHRWVCGELWNLRGKQITGREKTHRIHA